MQGMYSMRSPAVKRLMKEAYELREPTEQYECHPLEDNLFEWHFTIRGPAGTEFEGGLYHGRIILPPEYPMKPPSIILLTSNGRFETNKKICLSISGHHPESWQPSWSIRTALLAIIGFMPTHGAGALGSLDYTPDERKRLAKRSQDFKCPNCGNITNILKEVTEDSETTKREAEEVAAQMSFQDEQERNAALKAAVTSAPPTATSSGEPVNSSSQPSEPSVSSPQTVPQAFPQAVYQQMPQQMSHFPFRMPFMPQFPASPSNIANPLSQPNLQNPSNALSQVPRFPLPFVSPFMTQFPPFMPPGGLPMPPGAQGMFAPPWSPTPWQGPVSTPGNTRATTTPTSSATSQQSSVTTAAATSVTAATAATSVTSVTAASVSTSTVSTSETQQTTTSASADSEATPSQPAADTSQTAAETSATPTTRTVIRRTVVRRRVPATSNAARTSVNQSAELGRTNRRTESSTGFIVFVTVIISIIVMLLLKRMYSMNIFSSLY